MDYSIPGLRPRRRRKYVSYESPGNFGRDFRFREEPPRSRQRLLCIFACSLPPGLQIIRRQTDSWEIHNKVASHTHAFNQVSRRTVSHASPCYAAKVRQWFLRIAGRGSTVVCGWRDEGDARASVEARNPRTIRDRANDMTEDNDEIVSRPVSTRPRDIRRRHRRKTFPR